MMCKRVSDFLVIFIIVKLEENTALKPVSFWDSHRQPQHFQLPLQLSNLTVATQDTEWLKEISRR